MANNPYVNKVIYGDQTVMDISDTDATPADVLSGRKFYLGSGAPATGTAISGVSEEELRDTVGWVGKNLLINTASSTTKNGVTFTVNLDKSVTVNGTASSDWVSFDVGTANLGEGDYIISGVRGGETETYRMALIAPDTSTVLSLYDGERSFTVSDSGIYTVRIIVRTSGYVANNVNFYPMIRKSVVSDDTYEPYHETVEEVIEQVYVDNGILGAKNLFTTKDIISGSAYTTVSDSGKTIRVNNDTAGTYKMADFKAVLEKNTNYTLTTSADVTSGHGRVAIADSNNSTIAQTSDYTADEDVSLSFNSGNNAFVHIKLLCTTTVSEVGDITYTDTMLRLASDSDSTYQPYAMTNKELTDSKMSYADNAELGASSIVDFSKTVPRTEDVSVTFINNGFTVESINNGTYLSSQTVTTNLIAGKRYKLLFDVIALSGTSTLVGVRNSSNVTQEKLFITATGSYEFEFTWGSDYYIAFFVTWSTSSSGSLTVDNVQVRLITDTDTTYQPYSMTNKELTNKAYNTDDTAETTLADGDYFPFYDTSASGKRKTLWSNIKAKINSLIEGKIVDNLTSTSTTNALSAKQGKVLDGISFHTVWRCAVTCSAGATVRIPASGTNSYIKSNWSSLTIPICEKEYAGESEQGVPCKFKSIQTFDGYCEIVVANDLSGHSIGVAVLDCSNGSWA